MNEFMNMLYNSGVGRNVSGTHWQNGHFQGVITDVRVMYGSDLEITVDDTFLINASQFFNEGGVYSNLELY